jgi:dephospho-CoA kinase
VRQFLLVGLTGGIATGKSTVSEIFRRLGGVILDADLLAREVVQPGEPALMQIAAEFGRDVLQADGTLDRKKLGALVFGNAERRKRLEQLTHPAIRNRFQRRLAELEARGFDGLVFWDAPVMIESGGHRDMDRLVVVATDEATQSARLCARDSIETAEADRKIRSQMSVAEKAKLADYVIDNGGDCPATERQVRLIYEGLEAEVTVAKMLLGSHSTRRVAPLGVVFSVNLGNRGRNEIPPGVVFRDVRIANVGPEFLGYHWRKSGSFVYVRPDTDADVKAAAAVSLVTKLDSVARPFCSLVQLNWHVPEHVRTTPHGSVILDDASGTWRLVTVFLSEEISADERPIELTPKIKLLAWPSGRDVLCAYDRPSEPGDVGQVTRAVVSNLRSAVSLPKLLGSGRALSVVRDILGGKGVRR